MNLYASIARRKSCRKYETSPLGQDFMDQMESAIQGFDRLYPDVEVQHRLTGKVKGSFHVPAPQNLVISGKGQAGEFESAGFLFQQLVLWLDAQEIGSVWLGGSKDTQMSNSGDIIVLAFGQPAEPVHRTREEFKRKPLADITNAPEDLCIQAAHLAPSGVNIQPWYFEKQEGRVLLYQQKLKLPLSLMYKHSDVDMGIALCHYALACKETGKSFAFRRSTDMPGKADALPFGIITE